MIPEHLTLDVAYEKLTHVLYFMRLTPQKDAIQEVLQFVYAAGVIQGGLSMLEDT